MTAPGVVPIKIMRAHHHVIAGKVILPLLSIGQIRLTVAGKKTFFERLEVPKGKYFLNSNFPSRPFVHFPRSSVPFSGRILSVFLSFVLLLIVMPLTHLTVTICQWRAMLFPGNENSEKLSLVNFDSVVIIFATNFVA